MTALFAVGRTAAVALRSSIGHLEPLAALAHPSDSPRRNAYHQSVRWNVRCHDRSGPDERVRSERDAAHHRSIRTYRRTAADQRTLILVLAPYVTSRGVHIGEHTRWAAEHVVFENDAFVDRDVVLDLDVVADLGIRHHDHVLTEGAPFADLCGGHDVTEMPNLGPLSNGRTVIDVCTLMHEKIRHLQPS